MTQISLLGPKKPEWNGTDHEGRVVCSAKRRRQRGESDGENVGRD